MSDAGPARDEIEFSDFADFACPKAGGRTARQAYEEQKLDLTALLERLAAADMVNTVDSEAAASLLHNLAGTATYFGEDQLGQICAELEFPMRHAVDPATLHCGCRRLLLLIKAG